MVCLYDVLQGDALLLVGGMHKRQVPVVSGKSKPPVLSRITLSVGGRVGRKRLLLMVFRQLNPLHEGLGVFANLRHYLAQVLDLSFNFI